MYVKRCIIVLLMLIMCSAVYAVPQTSGYAPVEWYNAPSMFFRSITNPAIGIPVMASDGYRLPVDIGNSISISIGSTTINASPVYADQAGSTTLALVDFSRRLVINVGSETIGLMIKLISMGADIASLTALSNPSGYAPTGGAAVQIPANTAVNLAATIPASASHGFAIRVFGDECVICNHTGITTGTYPAGDLVASSAVFRWDGDGRSGDTWIAARNGLVASYTIWGW